MNRFMLQATHLRWFEGIICWEVNCQEKYSTLIGTVILLMKKNHCSLRSYYKMTSHEKL